MFLVVFNLMCALYHMLCVNTLTVARLLQATRKIAELKKLESKLDYSKV